MQDMLICVCLQNHNLMIRVSFQARVGLHLCVISYFGAFNVVVLSLV